MSFIEYVTQCLQHSDVNEDCMRLEQPPLRIGEEAPERLCNGRVAT